MNRDEILALDRRHVWHPYSPVDAWEKADPIVVGRAWGSTIEDVDGRRYLDGNAQWWVTALGHGHPRLLRVLAEQAATFAHVSLAGVTHEPAAALASELAALTGLDHVFYTDNGSTAVEAAIKIAVQHFTNLGRPQKKRFIALDGAFHGDTVGASSLGGVEVFRRPFGGVLFECFHAPFPDEGGYERAFEAMADLLRREGDTIAAVVVEPILQGASGMRIYDAAYLRALREATERADVLLIADEVFTGYGRTGKMWACQHAGITPDVMCLGKAFACLLPMGATLVSDRVYRSFRGGADKTLWYGHTFCGHPLGAALAREVLAIYRDERIVHEVERKSKRIAEAFARLPNAERVRTIGLVGAADLGSSGYLGERGWKVFEEAKKRGAYLRPLGDTVYVCPPLVIEDADLDRLLAILEESVRAV